MYSLSRLRWPLLAVSASFLPACASNTPPPPPADTKQAARPSVIVSNAPPIKLVATGRGAMGYSSQYTYAQQKLLAMRAAQLDAYRNLAEQIHGLRIQGNTATSAAAIQNDIVRGYMDAQLRGARVVSMTALGEGNWEAVVEMEITPAFKECMRAGSQCAQEPLPAAAETAMPPAQAQAPAAQLAACNTAGCTGPSAGFVSK